MRFRSRYSSFPTISRYSHGVDRAYTNHPENNFSTGSYTDLPISMHSRFDEIIDDVSARPRKAAIPFKERVLLSKSERKALGLLRNSSGRFRFDQVHPCTHTKTIIELPPLSVSYSRGSFQGNFNNEYIETTSDHWDQCGFWAGSAYPPDPLAYLQSISKDYTADPFITPDWFALLDSFNEACDSFIPSSFMLGEDIAENAIFIDALKCILNPTNAIKVFLKHFLKHKHRLNGKTLGDVARLSKDVSNDLLSYQFGVKPAIDDIRAALFAHKKVSGRMRYLNDHAGQYTPVRVRRDFVSPVSNFTSTTPNTFLLNCTDKRTINVISCWGRVREDLNFADTWSAYLQYFGLNKIVGLAWELIPFSFVIDWFTNAQERINSLTRLRTGGPFTQFKGLTFSTKQRTLEEYLWVPWNDVGFDFTWISPTEPVILARINTSSYSRFLKVPETSGIFDLSNLGLFHSILGGALLIQKFVKG